MRRSADYLRLGSRTIARLNHAGAVTYTYADHLGSPAAAANASGSVIWRENHAPFGEARQRPVANDNAEGFTGHIADAATGLVYMQARYYDPAIGRFLSSDPVGFAQSGPGYFNRYAYVMNDPVNATDPTGMCREVSGADGESHTIGLCLDEGLSAGDINTLNSAIDSMNAFAGYDVVAEIDALAEQLFHSIGGDASAASNSLVALTMGTHQFFQNGPMSNEIQDGTIAYSGADLLFLGRNVRGGALGTRNCLCA